MVELSFLLMLLLSPRRPRLWLWQWRMGTHRILPILKGVASVARWVYCQLRRHGLRLRPRERYRWRVPFGAARVWQTGRRRALPSKGNNAFSFRGLGSLARENKFPNALQAYTKLFEQALSQEHIAAILSLFGWEPSVLPLMEEEMVEAGAA